jgi:hypothetical protein
MNFYIQPEDKLVLSLFLEDDGYADLKAYLRDQSMFEKVSERGMAFDHALDPHAVVETFRHSQVVVKVAHDAMQVGKEAVGPAVGALVAACVQKRNEKKKGKIEAKEAEPYCSINTVIASTSARRARRGKELGGTVKMHAITASESSAPRQTRETQARYLQTHG